MLRKLAIAIAASGAMISTSHLHALGMGEIELESALNQPLDARIKLLKASELENWEIKPNLASVEEFDKTGVDRVFFLNNIKFEVERIGPDVFVNISTKQAVVEPFLNFLVRVDWPNGRLLREYTLLLDPPVFTEDAPAPVEAPEVQYDEPSENLPGMAPAATTASAYQEPVAKEQPKPAAPVAKAKPKKPATYKVRANDTLWEVAIRTRENRRITPQQAMLAIQDLNPDAFINGNINRLKKNQVLRVPSKEQMLSRSFNESVAEVAMQNQAIAQRKAKKAQLDATRKEFVNEREDKLDDSRLKLLAGGEATTDMERGASGQVAAETAGDQARLDKELSLAFENLDKSQRENQELRTRLDALEDQINTLQRLINLKDEQMVALQSGVAQREELKTNKPADVAVIADEKVAKDLAELQKTDMPVKAEGAEDLNFAAEDATKKAPKAEDTVKNKSVPAPQPMDEPFDPVAFVIENPPVMGGVLGALLAALLGVNFFRKRKEQQLAESQQGTALDADDPLAQADLDLDADLDNEFSDLDMGETEGSDFPEMDVSDSSGDLAGSMSADDVQGGDVLGEAEGYLAYGRLEPARDLLLKALESQPARMDVRIKLAEVASGLSDESLLAEQVAYVEENGTDDDKSKVSQLQSGEFASDLTEDGFEGLDLGDTGDLENDSFDLDLESGDLDVSTDLDSLGNDDLEMGESDLDFDLEGLELNEPEAATELEGDDSGLEFDLDLGDNDDLDLSLSEESASELSELETDDVSLDFELDDEPDLSLDGLDVGEDDSDIADLTLDEGNEFSLDFEAPEVSEVEESLEFESTEDLSNTMDFELPESDDALELNTDEDLSLELAGDELGSLDDELSLDSLDDLGDLSDLEEPLELDADDTSLDFAELEASLDSEPETLDLDAGDLELDLPEDGLDELAEVAGSEESIDLDMDSLDLGSEFDELPELDADDAVVLEVDDELPTLDDMQELNDLEIAADEELSSLDADLASLDDDLSDLSSADNHDDVVEISLSEADELPTLEEFEVSEDASSEAVELGGDLPELSSEDDDLDLDTDLDFLSGTDESETKLDLARAYIDMDDKDGAREILQEVLDEGSDGQKQEANQLLDGLA